jgi:histidyl-tRNA synthetase
MGDPEAAIKSQMKDANRCGSDYAVIYGENEARDNVYAVKDMQTGEQHGVRITEMGEWLDRITAAGDA